MPYFDLAGFYQFTGINFKHYAYRDSINSLIQEFLAPISEELNKDVR